MRIVYCISTLAIGGAEKQALLIAEQMRKRGHVVLILVLFSSASIELETKLPTMRLNQQRSLAGFVRAWRTARSFLAAFGADIIHSHTYPANLFARLLRLSGTSGCVLNTFHNVIEGGWFRRQLARSTRRWMSAATAVSEAVRVCVVEQKLAAVELIRVIPNGIPIEDYQPEPKLRRETRRELGAEGRFVWIAIGRIAKAKDYPNLLRAFAQVREKMVDCQLWIVGGVGQDRYEEENLRLAEQLKGATGVRWLGTRTDVVSLLNAADAFVLASAWEGAPLVIAEAMAMKLPVVATDVGGVVEILDECGEVAPGADSAALAQAMLRIMQSERKEILQRTDAGRARVEHYFAIDPIATRWESFYCGLVERQG